MLGLCQALSSLQRSRTRSLRVVCNSTTANVLPIAGRISATQVLASVEAYRTDTPSAFMRPLRAISDGGGPTWRAGAAMTSACADRESTTLARNRYLPTDSE